MPTDLKINLVLSLVPVGARGKTIQEQNFALHLSAAFDEATTVAAADLPKELLYPWKEEETTGGGLISGWRVANISYLSKPTAVSPQGVKVTKNIIADEKNPAAVGENLRRLQKELGRVKSADANAVKRFLTWKPASITDAPQAVKNDENLPRLIEAVHALSLYAGNVPNESNTLFFSRLDAGDWTPADGDAFVALPHLQIKNLPTFEPPDVFDFVNFKCDYPNAVDYKDFKISVTAYIKPLTVEILTTPAAGNFICFDNEKLPSEVGPDFTNFWFRSLNVHPWSDNFEQIVESATRLDARMRDAQVSIYDASNLSAVWEDLESAQLALFAQWKPLSGTTWETHDQSNLEGDLNFLNLSHDEVMLLKTALATFRSKLSSANPGENQNVRSVWLDIFKLEFDEKDLTPREVLRRRDEQFSERGAKPENFASILFLEWNYAVNDFQLNEQATEQDKTNLKSLRDKWNKDAEKIRKLFAEKETELMNRFAAKTFRELADEKTFDAVKARLQSLLLELRGIFEAPEYVPRIVNQSVIDAAVWNLLWTSWTNYVEKFKRSLAEPSKTESKPSGLTIQFDKLAAKSNKSPKEDDSIWRKIAGVGLLVREKEKAWHLATAATINAVLREVRVIDAKRIDGKTIEIKVDVNSIAGAKHDLLIGGKLFQAVFETRATSSGSIVANQIKVMPSFAAPDASGVTLLVKSVSEKLIFTNEDLGKIEFVRKPALLSDTAWVPLRVPYKNGFRSPFLTYNQRSLIAPTALADAVKNSFSAQNTRSDGKVNWEPLYEFGAPRDKTKSLYKLVPLKFGKDYEMAAFMIDTAGGLPNKLHRNLPWIFSDDDNVNLDDIESPDNGKIVQEFKYRRRVPVGQVRISAGEPIQTPSGGKSLMPKTWQEVPANVFPLAWEVNLDNVAAPPHPAEQKDKRKQLVLLPDEKSYVFGVKLPTVDIDVLEHSLPFDTDMQKNDFIAILTDYFKRLNARKTDASNEMNGDAASDISIDDPALKKILFLIENYDFDNRKWTVVAWEKTGDLAATARKTLRDFQSDWIKVECVRAGAIKIERHDDKNFTVSIDEADATVARLRVFALVDKNQPMFEQDFFEMKSEDGKPENLFLEDFTDYGFTIEQMTKFKEDTKDFYCLKPYQILLETPNAKMPVAEKLWRSLELKLEGNRDTVAVSLKKAPDADEKIQRRNVIRCELRRQQWRWQGRPIERENKTDIESLKTDWAKDGGIVPDAIAANEEFLKWELTAFAEMREGFDLITIPLPYSLGAPELLYRDGFEKDSPARFVRYGLRVFSRYEGLYAEAAPVTTKQVFTANDGKEHPLSGTGWKRALIRYRGAKPAKPLVQVIVPLTEPFRTQKEDAEKTTVKKASSLLLVLDQTAHAQCGITEQIECELVRVDLPNGEGQLYQAGHDPILREDPSGFPNPIPATENNPLKFKLTGAFGHTFDTGARQPLFGSSSYVIQAELAGDKYKSIFEDWDFAKIRFRRLSGEDGKAEEADWTDSIWVQFPSSSAFVAEQNGLAVTVSPDKIFRVNFSADAVKFPMLKYCLILTQEISDFRGQRGSETYHGLVNLTNDAGGLQGTFGGALPADPTVKARLVEIQITHQKTQGKNDFEDLPANETDFWESLFKLADDDNKDSENLKYRITRISPVIKVEKEN